MTKEEAKKMGATHIDTDGRFWDVKDENNILRWHDGVRMWFPYFYKLTTAKRRYKLKPL